LSEPVNKNRPVDGQRACQKVRLLRMNLITKNHSTHYLAGMQVVPSSAIEIRMFRMNETTHSIIDDLPPGPLRDKWIERSATAKPAQPTQSEVPCDQYRTKAEMEALRREVADLRSNQAYGVLCDLMRMVTDLQFQVDELNHRLDRQEHQSGKAKLPFREEFPELGTIVRLKAQLWKNEPRQGVSTYMIKIAVWDRLEARDEAEQKAWPNGYYNNWCFPLTTRDRYADERWCNLNPEYWLGCVAHKGSRKCKGTRPLRDHMAFLHPETRHLLLHIRGRPFEFVKGTPIVLNDPKAPCHVWYLDL
jgi:hypothetical protein